MSMPHICTIQHETSQLFLPYSQDDKNIIHRILRMLKNSVMVWKHHPQISQYCKSKTSYLEERKREFRRRWSTVIHPLSFFWFYSEIVLATSYLFAFIYFPMVGLVPDSTFVKGFIFLPSLLELIFILEIFTRFFVGRLDARRGNVDTNKFSIVRKYFWSFEFVADVFGAFPVILMSFMGIRIPYPYSMVRCIKFWRIRTFFECCDNLWKKLQIQGFTMVARILVIIFLCFHWTTFVLYDLTEAMTSTLGRFHNHTALAEVREIDFPLYIITAWRSVGLLLMTEIIIVLIFLEGAHSTVKINSTLQEKAASLIFLVLGKIAVIVFAVIFINQILRMSELTTKYQGILNQVHEYMAQRKLPMTTRERILTFYEYKFQQKYVRESNIYSILSDRLKREINFYTTNKLLNTVTMFEEIPTDIVTEILSDLKIEMYLPNDIIVRSGYPTDSMYFIASGTVAVTTVSGREVCHLHDGAYFGEASLILNHKKSISNVTALEICETYRLVAKTFRRCLRQYPEVLSKWRKEAEEREQKTQQFEREFQEKLFQKTFVGVNVKNGDNDSSFRDKSLNEE